MTEIGWNNLVAASGCNRDFTERVLGRMADITDSFDEVLDMLDAIRTYGMTQGIDGYIYYDDTTEFWNENKAELKNVLTGIADGMGMTYRELCDYIYKRHDIVDGKKYQKRQYKVWAVVEYIADNIMEGIDRDEN